MSNELWLFGEWEKSNGCVMERNVALSEFKPIRVVTGWIAERNGYMPVFDHTPRWLKLDAKKALLPTEPSKEISQEHCTIGFDLSKVESLTGKWSMEDILRNEG